MVFGLSIYIKYWCKTDSPKVQILLKYKRRQSRLCDKRNNTEISYSSLYARTASLPLQNPYSPDSQQRTNEVFHCQSETVKME